MPSNNIISEAVRDQNKIRQNQKVEKLMFMSGLKKDEIAFNMGYKDRNNIYAALLYRGLPKDKEIMIDMMLEIEQLKYDLHRARSK